MTLRKALLPLILSAVLLTGCSGNFHDMKALRLAQEQQTDKFEDVNADALEEGMNQAVIEVAKKEPPATKIVVFSKVTANDAMNVFASTGLPVSESKDTSSIYCTPKLYRCSQMVMSNEITIMSYDDPSISKLYQTVLKENNVLFSEYYFSSDYSVVLSFLGKTTPVEQRSQYITALESRISAAA